VRKWRSNGFIALERDLIQSKRYASPNTFIQRDTHLSYKIAIVEDDPDQRHNYTTALEKQGYEINAYADRASAREAMSRSMPDLVVLDIILGNEIDAGFQLCRELLAIEPSLPVLFLTERVDEIDKISGLRLGAWDYQPKPVSLGFLVERIASLLRLKALRDNPAPATRPAREMGHLSIDEDAMQIHWREQLLELTITEFRLIAALARRPGYPVAYEALMQATIQQYVTRNTINTHMRNIRRKFCALDNTFACIGNEYGHGYRWVQENPGFPQ